MTIGKAKIRHPFHHSIQQGVSTCGAETAGMCVAFTVLQQMMKVGLAGSYLRSFNLFEMQSVLLCKELEEDEQERGGENARGHNRACLKCKAGLLLNSATAFAMNIK